MAFQRSLDHPPTDEALDKQTTAQLYRGYLNGTATTKDFQNAFAPPDGSPGKISKANLDFLMGTAKKGGDGSVTVQFGGCDGKTPNCLPITPGWNYMVRIYRPRKEVLDGTWKFPEAEPVK